MDCVVFGVPLMHTCKTFTHTYMRVHKHYIHMYTHTTYICTQTLHTYICTHTLHTYVHTHYIHMCIYTHTCTQLQQHMFRLQLQSLVRRCKDELQTKESECLKLKGENQSLKVRDCSGFALTSWLSVHSFLLGPVAENIS